MSIRIMNRQKWWSLVIVLAVPLPLAFAADAAAQENESSAGARDLWSALRDGQFAVQLRLRPESVSDEAFELNAFASTLSTALGYKTLRWSGFQAFLEGQNVSVAGGDRYNNVGAGDLGNGHTDRPVVADPAQTHFNRWWLEFTAGKTSTRAGRQEILFDNHRFVGNVGWRQHHQTYEALTFTSTDIPRTKLTYAFVDRVHRVNGASQDNTTHLVNASTDLGRVGEFSAYGYFLGFDDQAQAGLSTSTVGGQLKGSRPIGGVKVLYAAQAAVQRNRANNPGTIRANYQTLMVGGQSGWLTLQASWERLSGSPADGQFTTTLATLHAFNGWADKFLKTPTKGLQDLRAMVAGKHGPVSWTARYHDFRSATRSDSYGSEVDLQVTYRSTWSQTFGGKVSLYRADLHASDTSKIWCWTAYSF